MQLLGLGREVSHDFHQVSGERIRCDELKLARARDFAQLVHDEASPYVSLMECTRTQDGNESVVVNVKATIPQESAVALSRLERLKVEFRPEDDRYPDIRALRLDFPRNCVIHLNLVPAEEPASLCLFAHPWNDIKLRLTANELLFRIQTWLNDTAAGTLHREDQPLEPLFLTGPPPNTLILSPKFARQLFEGAAGLQLMMIIEGSNTVFMAARNGRLPTGQALPALVVPLVSEPHEHCILYNQPRTFAELDEQLRPILANGKDLLAEVQKVLLEHECKGTLKQFGFLVLLLVFLRKRHADSEPEPEIGAFFCIGDHAQDAGLTAIARSLGLNGGRYDTSKRGQELPVMLMSVRQELTPESAAMFCGNAPIDMPLVAIGAGALGSQVILQGVRGGLARWTVIDGDVLLPHNLVRHALGGQWLGYPKAKALALESNNLLDEPIVVPIVADLQEPSDQAETVALALQKAGAIVDMSASVSVARDLAFDAKCKAKRCSLFVSPAGKDLVFFGEDAGRSLTLDHIEAQYYRAVASDNRLSAHLLGGSTIGSCRNITSLVPQDLMGLHASQGLRILRNWLSAEDRTAHVVCSDELSASCVDVQIPLGVPVEVGMLREWRLLTDSIFLDQVREQRAEKLPDETGGVLLAHVDVHRRIVYVTHQIPAPPDSKRQPTMYIRGAQGLAAVYDEISKRTLNNLVYIGEWHSHPNRSACSPSSHDLEAGVWLAEKTREGSLPGIMLIVGDQDQTCWMHCSRSAADAPVHLFLKAGQAV